MSDHNSETPWLICQHFWLRNSGKSKKNVKTIQKRSLHRICFCIIFGSFLHRFASFLHSFSIFLHRLWTGFHRFWIVFPSFLDCFCIVLFAHTFSQGQYLTYLKKGKCLDKKLKNICFSYSMPSFDPESKYRHKTSDKTKQLNQLSCPLSVYLCWTKKKKKRSNWTNSPVLSLYIYVAKKREKTKQLNQLSCSLSVYLCCKKKRKNEATKPTLLSSLCISMVHYQWHTSAII